MTAGSSQQSIRVAIIGAGPAGFYAANHLLSQSDLDIEVDMFDRLPTPFGLVRHGVAPDHPKIKNVTKVFDKTAQNHKFRFFGNVTCGEHLKPADLRQYYHQIIYTVGAQTDRRLNIPGEDLAGSHSATEFVAWYNGHPYYRDLEFDLTQENVAIVGMGNVAIDVARILCRTVDELRETDIADYALDQLAASKVKNVVMLGRRGPAQAAFTLPELKELNKLHGAQCRTLPQEAALDDLSKADLEAHPDASVQQKVQLIQEYASAPEAGMPRKLTIRFLVSPTEIIETNGRVGAIKIVHNKLTKSDDGSLRPRATDISETLDCGLVFRSVGYQGVPLEGVPFHSKWAVIPNQKGRVVDDEKVVHVGEYCAGWIKRGPSGLIGTNKGDAIETVECMIEDIRAGKTLKPAHPTAEEAEKFIHERQPAFFSYDHWRTLDEHELNLGKQHGRPRVKLTTIESMLDALSE
ncbi:MAG: FAD-dependent oxidoreductase [Phycisphaeraceae bacterium]|nr:FAD-dependent oxidoreductase [Phycisphaeraceae bacterium]